MGTTSSKSSGHSPSMPSISSMVSTLDHLPEQAKKFEYFTMFPNDVQKEIWGYLGLKDKSALASSSTVYKQLLSTELMTAKLLMLVAQGAQTRAQAILVQHGNLSLLCSDVTDYSGRKFKSITAYEYAYWAKDTHMCRMLERTMDENTKAAMLEKVTAIDTVGLSYEQGGQVVEHSKHFDMTPLKTALQNYVNGYDAWDAAHNYDAMKAAWMRVGLAQRDLPVHVINEYCRLDRSFHPLSDSTFNEDNLPRILTYYNFNTGSAAPLFPLVVSGSSGLGLDFAVARGSHIAPGAAGRLGLGPGSAAWFDLAAVSRLDEVRTVDLTRSRENLLHVEPEHGLGLNL